MSRKLSEVGPGEQADLLEIKGGGYLRRRLTELGFIAGEKIKVIRNSGYGPVVLTVKGSRIVLGRGEAGKVSVI